MMNENDIKIAKLEERMASISDSLDQKRRREDKLDALLEELKETVRMLNARFDKQTSYFAGVATAFTFVGAILGTIWHLLTNK